MDNDLRITQSGFLQAFLSRHHNRPDRPFCFVLGAGASKPSGIPTGGELAMTWLGEIHEAKNFEGLPLEEWATADRLGIAGFTLAHAAESYPQIYELRFASSPEDGYAFLEKAMENIQPSYGYSILSYILSETQHKIVITTNFDNLVADALSLHSRTFPRIVGHDELVSYVRTELRRPLIAKIHGDRGFAMKSRPDEIACLPEGWNKALKRILEKFTPIFIGYAGNDGSLMGCLESLPDAVPDTMYWCYRKGDTPPERVLNLIKSRKGNIVEIEGFDELMLRLQNKLKEPLNMPDLLERLRTRSTDSVQNYQSQKGRLAEAIAKADQSMAAPKAIDHKASITTSELEKEESLLQVAAKNLSTSTEEKPWWVWQSEINSQLDDNSKGQMFESAIAALPKSPELLGNYASFLWNVRKDKERAEEYYTRAIEADPKFGNTLGSYANFLRIVRKENDKAAEYYERALEADPKNASHLGNYASFLWNVRKDKERAEEYYKRAIEADPKHANILGNYSQLLFALGKKEGIGFLQRAEQNVESDNIVLRIELSFYRLAHLLESWLGEMKRMRSLIEHGDRSPDWPFDDNITKAEKDGHPEPELLRALAKVINDEAKTETLERFETWRNAK